MGENYRIITFPGTYINKIRPAARSNFLTMDDLTEIGTEEYTLRPVSLEGDFMPYTPLSQKDEGFDNTFTLEDKILILLVAALKQTSLSGSFGRYKKKLIELGKKDKAKLKEELTRVLGNSLGRSHNALADLIDFSFSFIAPRYLTLFSASFERGVKMLQKSTRRVEHDAYLIPKYVAENHVAGKKFIDTLLGVQDDFNNILNSAGNKKERINLREDAMYIQSLALLTSDYISASLRGWWQFLLESGISADEDANMIITDNVGVPSDMKKYSVEIFNRLKNISPLFVKKWKTNYTKSQLFPSANLFSNENTKLEELINTVGNKDFLVLNYNNPFGFTQGDIVKTIEAVREGDESMLSNLKMTSVTYLIRMDLSLLHEFLRHRTIPKEVESLSSAVNRAYAHLKEDREDFNDFHIPAKLSSLGYGDMIKEDYRKLIFLSKELVDSGIPAYDANIVVPHGLKVYLLVTEDAWNLVKLSGERMCSTAKKEMQIMMDLMKRVIRDYEINHNLSPFLSELMMPKCAYIGSCPENRAETCNKSVFINYLDKLKGR